MTKDQIKELRRLLREAMLARDKNTCQYCGSKTRVLATSHIYPKGKYRKMEYDLDNVVALCNMPCHLGWWHKEPIEAGAWIKDSTGL
jgi:5-methylcytosine-specific restriction endonuclease McrA